MLSRQRSYQRIIMDFQARLSGPLSRPVRSAE
jgi:hypothetical protein